MIKLGPIVSMEMADKSDVVECIGQKYRYRENRYFSDGIYCEKITFTLLKRKSCPGCERCEWLSEWISEDMSSDGGPQIPPGLQDFDVCSLDVIAEHRDWETGHVDDIEIGFVKV